MKMKKKQRTAEEEGGRVEDKGKGGGGSLGRGGAETAAELWTKFCKVRRDLVTPLDMDRPWITAQSLAFVDGFGAHTAIKLVGFIKGVCRVGTAGGGGHSEYTCKARLESSYFYLNGPRISVQSGIMSS